MIDAPSTFDSSVAPDALRRTLGQFATGVTIVTAIAPDGRVMGLTANSFSSVSLEPPLVLWSLALAARSFPIFSTVQRYAFSVLAADQDALSNRFASGRDDKFANVPVVDGLGGVPLIDGAAAHIECRQHAVVDGGDHAIIIGRVLRAARHDRPPLVFAQGRYGRIAN